MRARPNSAGPIVAFPCGQFGVCARYGQWFGTIERMTDAQERMSSQVRRACRKVAAPPTPWPPATGLNDSRLVFLAARPALDVLAQSRAGAVMNILDRSSRYTSRGAGSRQMSIPDMSREARGENMRSLVLACEDVAERLSAEEMAAVRTRGQLPAWFVPSVAAEARLIRKQWR